jgi:hypothetical protein
MNNDQYCIAKIGRGFISREMPSASAVGFFI